MATWEKWAKSNERNLARYAVPEAVRFIRLTDSPHDLVQEVEGRRRLTECIYQTLSQKGIRYALEKYDPSDVSQIIRTPAEILIGSREGTCLDLAVLFSGICLGNNLLPLLIIVDGHAIAAVSLKHSRKDCQSFSRKERELFNNGLLNQEFIGTLRSLVESGDYLAIECTGFAFSERLADQFPEGKGRELGLLSFQKALEAGREQLDHPNRCFRFALDVAALQDHLGHPSYDPDAVTITGHTDFGSASGIAVERQDGPLLREQVLRERVGVLEARERQHIDEVGRKLWDETQYAIATLSVSRAIRLGEGMWTWLSGDGRKASASIRGTAYVLFADLAVLEEATRTRAGRIDLSRAQAHYDRACEEFGADLTNEDAARLISLKSKISYLEGNTSPALSALENTTDPTCISLKISILLEENRADEAVDVIRGVPLHEKWCDRALTAHAINGDEPAARRIIDWSRNRDNVACYHRCLLAWSRAISVVILGGPEAADHARPFSISDSQRSRLAGLLDDLAPVLKSAEADDRVRTGLQAEGLGLASKLCLFIGDREGRERYARLLGTTEPVSLDFANAVLRGDTAAPNDLPERLRKDHPEGFDAHLIASLIEAERLGRGDAAFDAARKTSDLAMTVEQKERLCGALFELSAFTEKDRTPDVAEVARTLLGIEHRLTKMISADHAVEAGDLPAAETILEECRAIDDPLWWQLSAKRKQRAGDTEGALTDLVGASEILFRTPLYNSIAALATGMGRFNIALTALERLLTLDPDDTRARHNLALTLIELQRYARAAKEFALLRTLVPEERSYAFNQAVTLTLSGEEKASLQVYDELCTSHPHWWPALQGRSNLLHALGRPDEAFQSLHHVRDQFWSSPKFLVAYVSLAHAAEREHEAGEGLRRLIELDREGKGEPTLFKSFDIAQFQEMIKCHYDQHKDINQKITQGQLPWLLAGNFLNRVSYQDWASRTQELTSIDRANEQADFSIYSTNGFAARHSEKLGLHLEPLVCAPQGQSIVADLSSLITLHELGLLEAAATYFGTIHYPANYPSLLLNEQGKLRHHQPARIRALREIDTAASSGLLHALPTTDQVGFDPLFVREYESDDEDSAKFYRLRDVGAWLESIGTIDVRQFDQLYKVSHKISSSELAPLGTVASGAGVRSDVITLTTLAEVGCLRAFLESASVYVDKRELEQLHRDLDGLRLQESLIDRENKLRSSLLSDPRFQATACFTLDPGPSEKEEPDVSKYLPLEAFHLAEEKGLPLLCDDRVLQNFFINRRPDKSDLSFGTDMLLAALERAGLIDMEQMADHFVRLMRWRYRFIVPSTIVLITLARRFRRRPPGGPLREVSRYAHDCMRDAGLFGGQEPTDPPTSMASVLSLRWARLVGSFSMHVWHDDLFSDEAAEALTKWAMHECLPSVPKSVPPLQANLHCSMLPQFVLMGALFGTPSFLRNPQRANRALISISRALGLNDDQYVDTITDLLGSGASEEYSMKEGSLEVFQAIASTAFAHFGVVSARAHNLLRRLGLSEHIEKSCGLAAEEADAIASRAQYNFVGTIPGPIAVVDRTEEGGRRLVVPVPVLFIDSDPKVRKAALRFFQNLMITDDPPLALLSRSVLSEYAEPLEDENLDRWFPAALRIQEVLADDFLLCLAGFRQRVQFGLQDGQKHYLSKVFRPGMSLIMTVPEAMYHPTTGGDETSERMSKIVQTSPTISKALDEYFDAFGHLPFAAPLSPGSLAALWIESRGDDGLWKQVWEWAEASPDPLRRYHACRLFAEFPALIPDGMHGKFWEELARFISMESTREEENLPASIWRARCDLAKYYLLHLEIHAPLPDSDRLACLAWWAAHQVIDCVLRKKEGEESGAEFLRRLHTGQWKPDLALTTSLWRLGRAGVAHSALRYGTIHETEVWNLSLFRALTENPVGLRPADIPEASLPVIGLSMIRHIVRQGQRALL